MRKNRGIKIYKSRNKKYSKRHTKFSTLLSVAVTFVIVGVVGFVGYSVVAPIMNYLKNKDEYSSSIESYIPLESGDSGSNSENKDKGKDESSKTETGDNGNSAAASYHSYCLTEEDMQSLDKMTTAIDQIKNNYTAVVVPLKATGGKLYYASKFEAATTASAVVSSVTLQEIYSLITSKNLTPIADISMLSDNIYPNTYGDTAYRFEDEDSMWLDNSPTNGGKPWMSAFSAGTKTYLISLATEIADAGFTEIIYSDVEFPAFRPDDLDYIGDIVKSETRYKALVDVVNQVSAAVTEKGAGSMLRVSAADISNNKSEVFKPSEITNVKSYVIDINLSDIGSEFTINGEATNLSQMSALDKVKTIVSKVKAVSPNANVIPCIDKKGLTNEELTAIKSALDSDKTQTYLIA